MGIEYVKGRLTFMSEVEDWMADQWSTEVFNFSTSPVTDEEKKLTALFDQILYDVVFGRAGIDESVARAQSQSKKLIQGRKPVKGEHTFGAWQGSTYDAMFKDRLRWQMDKGELKSYKGRLVSVPGGKAGPDVYLTGSPMIAWDITTQAEIEKHILRDSIGRLYDRYYLLIWDEPRTKPNRIIRALAGRQ